MNVTWTDIHKWLLLKSADTLAANAMSTMKDSPLKTKDTPKIYNLLKNEYQFNKNYFPVKSMHYIYVLFKETISSKISRLGIIYRTWQVLLLRNEI